MGWLSDILGLGNASSYAEVGRGLTTGYQSGLNERMATTPFAETVKVPTFEDFRNYLEQQKPGYYSSLVRETRHHGDLAGAAQALMPYQQAFWESLAQAPPEGVTPQQQVSRMDVAPGATPETIQPQQTVEQGAGLTPEIAKVLTALLTQLGPGLGAQQGVALAKKATEEDRGPAAWMPTGGMPAMPGQGETIGKPNAAMSEEEQAMNWFFGNKTNFGQSGNTGSNIGSSLTK